MCFKQQTYESESVSQSSLTLCDPVDCTPPVSSVYGILQARILEWVVIPFSRGSSQPRNRTPVSFTICGFFTIFTREALLSSDPCHRQLYSVTTSLENFISILKVMFKSMATSKIITFYQLLELFNFLHSSVILLEHYQKPVLIKKCL